MISATQLGLGVYVPLPEGYLKPKASQLKELSESLAHLPKGARIREPKALGELFYG